MSNPLQTSLFDDRPDREVRVVEVLGRVKAADKGQATFQRLVIQIEEQRTLLQLWQDYRARYSTRVSAELLPVQDELWEAGKRMAFLFDELLAQPDGLRKKRQRARLQLWLIELIQSLLLDQSDEELVAIHDKHSDFKYADDQELSMALSQDMIENLFGIRMGDEHGARSVEELFAKADQELRNRTEQAQQANAQQQKKRRKSRKAEEAEARQEQAQKEVSQSLREVYRKLASALHPDRETDAAARQRKTEQMQRVNQAYEAGDLLALLNLQLEIEQIDAAHLASLSAQRLAHYTQVLREQLAELKAEIDSIIAPFKPMVPYSRTLTPDMVDRSLSAEVERVVLSLEEIKGDLVDFRDPKKLAVALKDFESSGSGVDELADLAFLMEAFAPAAPAGRAKKATPKKRRK